MGHWRIGAAAVRALGLAAALSVAPGCTYLDKYEGFPGTPFTPDQPEAAVTVVGEIGIDTVEKASEGCIPGGTLFWGNARNTGDQDVNDVMIHINAFNAAGAALGTFSGSVFNGTVDVDQSGSFSVCSPLPAGSVARAEYRTSFVVAPVAE